MSKGVTKVGKDGFNKTHLSAEQAEARGIIHRDLIAHCFRWSHATKLINAEFEHGSKARIVDVGCGKEMPLAKTLYTNRLSPERYLGIDVNKLSVPDMFHDKVKFKPEVLGETDFATVTADQIGFRPNVITSFEVLEHMPPDHARKTLEHMYDLLDEEGVVLISTPCYDAHVGAADNHPNEMTYGALGALIEDLGFAIEDHWGTFASQKDYKPVLESTYGEVGTRLLNDLKEYYDANIIATIFAPLFPAQSRNCIWQLRKTRPANYQRKFDSLSSGTHAEPWSNHPDWQSMAPTVCEVK